MKCNENLRKNVPDSAAGESYSGITVNDPVVKAVRNVKKFICVAGLAGMGLLMNACTTGYVATEPVYVEQARPPQPSNLHIWIDGDWVYNRQSRLYVRHEGYWERPTPNRTYVTGHWQTTPHGQHWLKGHYQRNNNR